MLLNCLCVGAGGCIGAILRYLITLLPIKSSSGFPYKTLIINVVGSFVIGLIAAACLRKNTMDPRLVLFLKVGICGGFTTFSTFALETFDLLGRSNTLGALLYVLTSVILSICAVWGAGALI